MYKRGRYSASYHHYSRRMASVKKHLSELKKLQLSRPSCRYHFLCHSDLELIETINECIYNTLKGNIPLKKSEILKLSRFKEVLRNILHSEGLKKKRKIIIQSGGAFLPVLLYPIVSAGLVHFT